jgi:predicted Fe-S protein YdhL (DUF1289 family)
MKDYDPDAGAGPVPSPCINVCRMDPRTGLCEGCLRTLDEIAQWGSAGEEAKRAIWREIERRREALF